MQSFLITAKDPKKQEEYAHNLCKEQKIDPLDITSIEQQGESIGISEIRAFQKSLFLKPFKSSTKAVILKNAQNLTIAAQNALLKMLEEPPDNTLIILTAFQKEPLLPTILSRCELIELKNENMELSESEISQYHNILISLLSPGVGERLKIAQDVSKNKEEAVKWLEKMIIIARKQLIDEINKDNNSTIQQFNNLLISFQKTHTILKTTNVNPRFALENLFLSILSK